MIQRTGVCVLPAGEACRFEIHVSLFVFVVATLVLSWQASAAGWRLFALSIGGLAVLVASIVAHEYGHLRVARRFTGLPSSILLGPFGGLAGYPSTGTARSRSTIVGGWAAGQSGGLLCLFAPGAAGGSRVHALWERTDLSWGSIRWSRRGFSAGSAFAVAVKLVLWINGLLVLINLLPAFPFDGGRVLRSTLRVIFPSLDGPRVAALTFWQPSFWPACWP